MNIILLPSVCVTNRQGVNSQPDTMRIRIAQIRAVVIIDNKVILMEISWILPGILMVCIIGYWMIYVLPESLY